jgi:hypothetical protein
MQKTLLGFMYDLLPFHNGLRLRVAILAGLFFEVLVSSRQLLTCDICKNEVEQLLVLKATRMEK